MASSSQKLKHHDDDITEYRGQLLDWYDANKRELPWRASAGNKVEHYHTWLSEIMLQQTTVGAVIPYFLKFTQTWPTIFDLANAKDEDVMQAWAGLGYYARARNLLKAARIIAYELDGKFPSNQKDLMALPGIGDYTSAAILTIGMNKPATVMDGNIERVISRFFMVQEKLPKAKSTIKALTSQFFDDFIDRPGDLAQAFMDLGARVCLPRKPKCDACPLRGGCAANNNGEPELYPLKQPKKKIPTREGVMYLLRNSKGDILIHKRPDDRMLGGMVGLPTTDWDKNKTDKPNFLTSINFAQTAGHKIKHTFSHFHLECELYHADIQRQIIIPDDYKWISHDEFLSLSFPTVFKKAFRLFSKELLKEE